MRKLRFSWVVLLSVLALVAAACEEEAPPGEDGDGAEGPAILMAADGVLSDTYVTIPETEGMYFSGPGVPPGDPYQQFVQKYEEEYGEPPIQAFHAHAYDATTLLLTKIQEVAEVSGDTITIGRQDLRDALYATEGYEGLTGTLTCDVFGDCADPFIQVFQNTEELETITDLKANPIFDYTPGEDPLGTAGAEPPEAEPAQGEVTIGAGEPLKLGAIQVITTESASLGEDQVRGIEIAISDWGDFEGHPIQLQVEDDLCDSEGGTTAAEAIVADPQTVGIIGTSCSGAAVPASQIMSEAGLVMISGSNTSPHLTSLQGEIGTDWQPGYFRVAHNDQIQGTAAATYAYEELGVTTAATIHDGDPYTSGLAEAFGVTFEELGGEIVLATAVNVGDTDMRPVLTEVQGAGAELLFFPIFQPEADFIAKQAQEVLG
jgi:ABC-type branched-subunit amino acid transport system substrate-binding protein